MRPSPLQPDLSICIVAWNVRAVLKDCLLSIRRSRPEIDCEILVVDNNSSDGTAAMIEMDFPEVTLIRNDRNRGFAAASNQAIKSGRGRYLLLLNPDTLVPAGSLEEMTSFLDQRPAAGGAGPKLLNPDGSLQPSVRAFPTIAAAFQQFTILGALGLFRRARSAYLQTAFDYGRPAIVDQPMGAALFLRRAALDQVGLLDKRFFLYFEEVDLCRRLTRAGWPLWYNPAAVITHLGGASSRQLSAPARYWLLRSQLYYFDKHHPGASSAFRLVFKPLLVVGEIWGLVLSGLEALAAMLFSSSPTRRERKNIRVRGKLEFCRLYLVRFLRGD